ncbi:MAG TPA: biopolymer transporter ExbD [Gemmatimonadaceae bacterium]|jgi:biopolymer transport protein ExbD
MAMSASSSSGGGVKAEPNVTPMIDVMLVLLIIFMVVTPALLAGFNAVPPQGQNLKDHPEDTENDQVLGIDRDGNYYLNKKPISKTSIENEIKRIYSVRTTDKVMYLKADKDLEYSKVVDATDMAAKNGVSVVALITDQRPGTVSTVPGDVKSPQAGGKH